MTFLSYIAIGLAWSIVERVVLGEKMSGAMWALVILAWPLGVLIFAWSVLRLIKL